MMICECALILWNPILAFAAPQGVDAVAIQRLLDERRPSGGVVQLEARHYTVDKPLNVPEGVTLAGVWEAPHNAQLSRGTVFEVVCGKGKEDEPPVVTLNASSCIKGITFYYPDQRVPEVIPYPWTVEGRDLHGSVIDCTFVNSYKAIDFGTHRNELHYISRCYGCPLRVGVHIDHCTDIGRVEDVHFNPNYWAQVEGPGRPDGGALHKYLFENLVAFEFARTDWEYVFNTFCFGARIGYRFYDNGEHRHGGGTVNGNFLGIGADWCHQAILVEASQMPGLLITNGEFVGGEGCRAAMEVLPSNSGPVNLSNCSFWGPFPQVALLRGQGTVSFSQCNFLNQHSRPPDLPTLDAEGGELIVQGCRFGVEGSDINLGERVTAAAITGNVFVGGKEIVNHSAGDVQETANVTIHTHRSAGATTRDASERRGRTRR